MRTTLATLAAAGALLIPASQAMGGAQIASGGPAAHKSGAIVNYTSVGKVKVKKQMFIYFVCSVDCSATASTTIKGAGIKLTVPASGNIPANVQGFVQITPKGGLLKLLKAETGKFKLVNTITATDPTTGATDTISHAFKLKR
jgi:hypothetical protein